MTTQRVAILGGGLGGLVTALNLTAPAQGGRYDVTVYQLGWRLGGKCATGRNADYYERIQEHGLHVFMGQYQNAFATVQSLYAEAAHPPFADWQDAFTQQSGMTLMEEVDGEWIPWVFETPVFPGIPGIDTPPTPIERVIEIIKWIGREVEGEFATTFSRVAPSEGPLLVDTAIKWVGRLNPDSGSVDQEGAAAAIHRLRHWMAERVEGQWAGSNLLRRFFILADLALSSLYGGLKDGLLLDPEANLEQVNALDFKAWLRSHGAAEIAVESAPVRSLYDLVFAYPEGDWQGDGNVEAGTLFLSLLNTACYQGSLIWKFNTATGDLVMAPMYEVLKARGVRFEFFARVDALVPAGDGATIAEVRIGRQVALVGPDYSPLRILPSGQRVWPDRPLYDQIVNGGAIEAGGYDLESRWTPWRDEGLPLTLVAGRDFDLVVLAIPPAAHPVICAGLIAQKSKWREMVENIQTTATQSLQTWMTADEPTLGWTDPSLVGGYDLTPLNSWSDISPVLATEDWPASSKVVSEQIACGPFPCPVFPPPADDLAYPAIAQTEIETAAVNFLENDASVFWKARFGPQGPQPWTVVSRYSRANIDPSERYTLSVADSTKHRMGPGDSTYSNLYLTGDWIQNGQNLGSFEATTTSGMLTSRAISGLPATVPPVQAAAFAASAAPAAPTPPPPALPRFVDHGGNTTFPGPIALADTKMWGFTVDADADKMAAWCRKVFDEPSGGAVQVAPLASKMIMTIVDIGQGRFLDVPEMGWSPERELTFWIPALRLETDNKGEETLSFDFVMPYLVLDNPVAIASGREIFGYFKHKGWIALPGDPGQPAGTLAVDLFATKIFGPQSQQKRERLLTLTQVDATDFPLLEPIDSFGDAACALLAHLAPDIARLHPDPALVARATSGLTVGQVPQLFLKQFRDVADGRRACYQAITEAVGTVTGFEAGPQLIEFDMDLAPLDSAPIAADFGIAPQQRVQAVEIEYDLLIDPGRVLWQA